MLSRVNGVEHQLNVLRIQGPKRVFQPKGVRDFFDYIGIPINGYSMFLVDHPVIANPCGDFLKD